MKLNRIKLLAITALALPVMAGTIYKTSPVSTVSYAAPVNVMVQDDVAAQYKKSCALCHKATAEKFFEPSKMDEALIEIVLKGKKAEKPPNMPSYEEKGMTKDQAKLLVAYMRQIRTPASE